MITDVICKENEGFELAYAILYVEQRVEQARPMATLLTPFITKSKHVGEISL